jgi:hypothetical protein
VKREEEEAMAREHDVNRGQSSTNGYSNGANRGVNNGVNPGVNSGAQSGSNQAKLNQDSRRPKPVFFWNNTDVMKWLKRHSPDDYERYGTLWLEHEITGRAMVRLNDVTLGRMGISDPQHRDHILNLVLKLKLKSDILEMKDLEKKSEYSVASSMTMGLS